MVALPPPGADGFVVAAPTFSIRWAPPAVSALVLARLTLLHAPRAGAPQPPPRWLASNMLPIGAAADFGAQPVALTQPRRALVQPHYAPDYAVQHGGGVGVNGSGAAWRVGARAPAAAQADAYAFANAQPLVPLNASARYTFSAWCRLSANGSSSGSSAAPPLAAHLWLGLWEADDFNQNISTGPAYGRLAYMNSSVLQRGGLRGAPALWVSGAVARGLGPALRASAGAAGAAAAGQGGWALLAIAFTSPAFPTYADLRAMVLGGSSGDSAYFDQWALLQG